MVKEFAEGHRPRHRTLGWLSEVFYGPSEAEAAAILREQMPEAAVEDQHIVGPGDAPKVLRTDAPESVGISYHSYNPPAIWGAGYSVMRVAFPHAVPKDFMSHAGEELLIPVSGRVQYHFFWAPPGTPPRREELKRPVDTFELIRVNPQIPHHAWSIGESAEAWMIFRDASEVPAAISLDPSVPTRGSVQVEPRTLSTEALLDPSRYALAAWGVSERVRLHRQRAGLGVQELAALADVDPAQLSRLEAGTRNLSLDPLLRVMSVLRIPFLDLIETAKWSYERSGPARSPAGDKAVPILPRPVGLRHWLHPASIRLAKGWRGRIEPAAPRAPGDFTTWIILKGRLLLLGESDSRGSLVSAGSVVHFRGHPGGQIEALAASRILQVTDSGYCSCLGPAS